MYEDLVTGKNFQRKKLAEMPRHQIARTTIAQSRQRTVILTLLSVGGFIENTICIQSRCEICGSNDIAPESESAPFGCRGTCIYSLML